MTDSGGEFAAGAGAPRSGVIIPALGVGQIFAWGSSYYLLAVLAKPIGAETGWPLTWIVGGLSIGLVVAGLVSPAMGRAINGGRVRAVMATGSALLAGGLLLLGLATNIATYFAAWVILGAGMGAGLYDAAFATLGRLYFSEARRLITALTLFGGLASTVCWPLSAFLLEHRVERRLPRLCGHTALPRLASTPACPAGHGGCSPSSDIARFGTGSP